MEISGRVALVTGGGTGIGRGISLALARAGAAGVAVNYSVSSAEAESTAAEVESLGSRAVPVQADISGSADVVRMVAGTIQHFGRLDVLINNAGVTRVVPLSAVEEITEEDWDRILGVNVKGTWHCCQTAAPELRRTRGAIVNIASVAGLRAEGSSIPYMVSKAGVIHMTRALAVALAPEVRVNAVAPGLVRTRWFRRMWGDEAVDRYESGWAATTPLQSVVEPEHVAQAVLGLLGADMVTGEVVVVDSGKGLA